MKDNENAITYNCCSTSIQRRHFWFKGLKDVAMATNFWPK